MVGRKVIFNTQSLKKNSPLSFFKRINSAFFFLIIIISFSVFLVSDSFAATNIRFDSFSPCYNSRTYVGDLHGVSCYDGNWRVRYRIHNTGDTGNDITVQYFTIPLSIDYDYGFDSDYFYLGPSSYRDVNRTISARLCSDLSLIANTPIICDETNPTYFKGSCDPHYLFGVDGDVTSQNVEDIPQCQAVSTPTPTVVSCSPSVISQTSYSGSGTPLVNNYNSTQYKDSPQYTLFTAAKTGKLTKAEIYGSLDRDVAKGNKVLQCKVTSEDGSTTLGQSIINNGPFTKGNSWMNVDFTTSINLTKNATYRLYCKVNNVAGGGYIYWLDFWNNRTLKTYKISICN